MGEKRSTLHSYFKKKVKLNEGEDNIIMYASTSQSSVKSTESWETKSSNDLCEHSTFVEQKKSKDANEATIITDHSQVEPEVWPPEWSEGNWREKIAKYPWLIFHNRKLGCKVCKEFADFNSFRSYNIVIAKEWISSQVDGGENTKKETRLALLRNKIKKHNSSEAHKTAFNVSIEKKF
ncbi:E3 SUMO-protein ligase KIAA1586-like [Myzus persicae]|uniref:E3 SUMO-protein ligase KIAA1586-like n=1 Tax=Myzus persicae TaxID=13164 RepID=UPI000B938C16|nr:E3 SUMO-protein ligase KIAA1586-like [Myzus persicae]XP_022181439.1 E3 SUMO-protein ligase KIAA1586-like [Myzus persicae]